MPTQLNTAGELVTQATRRETQAGPLLHAKIEGEINLHNSPSLRADLLKLVEEEKPHTVVLNLADVPYMDSSAIAVLVEVLKAVRAEGGVQGGKVHLTQLQPRVEGLLHIARLDSIFEIEQTDEQAFEAARGTGEQQSA